jgi:hypothetical protein
MGNSVREYRHRNTGSKLFCNVSIVSRLRGGLNKSTALKTAELEDGILVVNLSAASCGIVHTTTNIRDGITLKNFQFKFEIIDAWINARVSKASTNLLISLNPTSLGVNASILAGTICNPLSLKQVHGGINRAVSMKPANLIVDKTDKLHICVCSGASNTTYSVRAYLRVIPART